METRQKWRQKNLDAGKRADGAARTPRGRPPLTGTDAALASVAKAARDAEGLLTRSAEAAREIGLPVADLDAAIGATRAWRGLVASRRNGPKGAA
jgi:hypothetical protein